MTLDYSQISDDLSENLLVFDCKHNAFFLTIQLFLLISLAMRIIIEKFIFSEFMRTPHISTLTATSWPSPHFFRHILCYSAVDYSPRILAKDIQAYFEINGEAREVLVFRGNRALSVSRKFIEGRDYFKMFMKRFLR